MSYKDKTTLKGYFADGKVPVESNYVDLIDSMLGGINIALNFPGLRTYYPMNATHRGAITNGQDYYLVDLVNGINLKRLSGSPSIGTSGDLRTYMNFGGGGHYGLVYDEPAFHITGTETDITAALRGLTISIWIKPKAYPSTTSKNLGIFSRWDSTNNKRCYGLFEDDPLNVFAFGVSPNGSSSVVAYHDTSFTTGNWYYVVARFSPSTSVDILMDMDMVQVTSLIPSDINNDTTVYAELGRFNYQNDERLNADVAMLAICAAYVPDFQLNAFYQCTKHLFK